MRLLAFLVLGFGVAVASQARAQCAPPAAAVPVPPAVPPRPEVQRGDVHSSLITIAPPGGVWTADLSVESLFGAIVDGCGPLQFRRIDDNGAGAVDIDVLREGSAVAMLRVPFDAVAGERFAPSIECGDDDGTAFGGSLEVDGGIVERAAPAILGETVSLIEPPAPGAVCDDTPSFLPEPRARYGNFTTQVSFEVQTDAAELLVDATLTASGAPADEGEPFLEMFAMALDDARRLRVDITEVGLFDLHVVVTDIATGLASDPRIVVVNTPPPEFQGCTCATGAAPDALAPLVGGALVLIARWRRRRRR